MRISMIRERHFVQCEPACISPVAVTLDRCPVNADTAGSLTLGDALLHRLDDLLSEVQRVRSHYIRTAAPQHRLHRIGGECAGTDQCGRLRTRPKLVVADRGYDGVPSVDICAVTVSAA